jgi:hypothetical protein
MKPVHALIVIAPLLLAGQCNGLQVNVREACEVLKATLYQDGQFAFNDAEIDALTEKNQIKIDAVKRFYRKSCVK